MAALNGSVHYLMGIIAEEMEKLNLVKYVKTYTSRHVQFAVRLVVPEELAKHSISQGIAAVTKFNQFSKSSSNCKRTSLSEKAGLHFPVAAIKKWLTTRFQGNRIANGAAVYLSAVIEYIISEIIQLSGNNACNMNNNRINAKHVNLSILNHNELSKLFKNTIISRGGVVPYINPVLLPPKYR